MSKVTTDPAKTPDAEQPKTPAKTPAKTPDAEQPKTPDAEQPKAAKKAAGPKTQRVRSCVGRFVILHTNTVIGEGEEKKVLVDEWVQAQINAGKLEIVVD